MIVSPDAGRVKTARNFARRIGTHWAVMEKERPAQQVAEIGYVVGDVKGKTAVLVDDMIDTAGTLCAAAQTVLDEGAARVIACATHGVFSGPAYERLAETRRSSGSSSPTRCRCAPAPRTTSRCSRPPAPSPTRSAASSPTTRSPRSSPARTSSSRADPGHRGTRQAAPGRPQGGRPDRPRQHAGELRRRGRGRRRHDRARRALAADAHLPLEQRAPLVVAHDWADAERRTPLTLTEALDAFLEPPLDKVEIDLDIKLPGREEELVEALRERGLIERAMVSTMELYSLGRIVQLAPELRRGWTYPKVTKDWNSKPWAKPAAAGGAAGDAPPPARPGRREAAEDRRQAMWVYHPLVSARLARICKLAGVELIAWTVDDEKRMRELVAIGVDGLCSNDPRLFTRVQS